MDRGRFRDEEQPPLHDLAGEVLAECPSCGGCARVVPLGDPTAWSSGVRRAMCGRCAWAREHDVRTSLWGGARDPYFGLPLWLRTRVGGEELWAFNERHLDLLESYVGATLRERALRTGRTSFLEKLPRRLKSAKNRDAVLAGVARLRERLGQA